MNHGLRMISTVVVLAMLLTAVLPSFAFADEEPVSSTTEVADGVTLDVTLADPTEIEDNTEIADGETVEGETTEETDKVLAKVEYGRDNNYVNFLKKYANESFPEAEFIIPAAEFVKQEEGTNATVVESYEGKQNVLKWDSQEGKITWTVDIPEGKAGLYNMALSYYPFTDTMLTIAFEMRIDGQIQFNSMKNFEFNRVFKNKTNEFAKDNRGNELRPEQVQIGAWQENIFKDSEGIYNEGFYFYLSEGTHTISLAAVGEGAYIEYLKIYQKETSVSYEEYIKGVTEAQIEASTKEALGEAVEIEGEDTYSKSHSMLSPYNDRTDALSQPYHASKIRINTIGGANWSSPGQWIDWQFDVETAGYYKIGVRYQQNFLRGMFVTRSIKLDGELPFEELGETQFPYTRNWDFKVLGEAETGEAYYFYLEPGTHTISMEVTLGDMAELLNQIDECVYQLNYLYRKVIMITSTSPDTYRTYRLHEKIDDLIPKLKEVSQMLKDVEGDIIAVTGGKGSEAATLEKVYVQLDSFIDDNARSLHKRLTEYKESISTLAAWVLSMKSQALALDYMIVTPANSEFKRTESNFWEGMVHEFNAFFASFTEDYNSVGNVSEDGSEKVITVWTTVGRDSANILKQMIDDMFTADTGIGVNLQLVQGSLIQAIAAGRNPDVINVDRTTPMNLAIRGSLVDLRQFDDFDEFVAANFTETATTAYTLEDAVYALPETQTFSMMFYRTDILEEFGLEPPQTWDDLYAMLPILQRNNLDVGASGIFGAMLYQAGGSYYNEDLTATQLTSKLSVDVFTKYTDLFSQYSLPVNYDLFNRFRTGEMPIGFTTYTFYNQLKQAAPEISGLWEMTLLPGTVREDGTVSRADGAQGSAIVAIKSGTVREEYAWEYLKWITGKDAQSRYGREIEGLLGPTARISTANIHAFETLDWPKAVRDEINRQREEIYEVPEVPGGYYLQRNINNAFNRVINQGDTPRDALHEWTKQTDSEIARKRAEFGLD